jgi:hypothetical protein
MKLAKAGRTRLDNARSAIDGVVVAKVTFLLHCQNTVATDRRADIITPALVACLTPARGRIAATPIVVALLGRNHQPIATHGRARVLKRIARVANVMHARIVASHVETSIPAMIAILVRRFYESIAAYCSAVILHASKAFSGAAQAVEAARLGVVVAVLGKKHNAIATDLGMRMKRKTKRSETKTNK